LRLALFIGAILLVGAILQVAAGPLGRLGLTPSPQHYVALDFPDAAALPTSVDAGATLQFQFQVVNDTGRPLAQPWETAIVTRRGSTKVIDRGMSRIGLGRSATVTVSTIMPVSISTTTVEVIAPGTGIAPLEFHVTEFGPGLPQP
jgi:hypothetical protein